MAADYRRHRGSCQLRQAPQVLGNRIAIPVSEICTHGGVAGCARLAVNGNRERRGRAAIGTTEPDIAPSGKDDGGAKKAPSSNWGLVYVALPEPRFFSTKRRDFIHKQPLASPLGTVYNSVGKEI